jgi:hypothetical protein
MCCGWDNGSRSTTFIDGLSHDQDYVQAIDANTRRRLQQLNYRPLVIRYDDRETGLAELARRLGVDLGT